MGKRNASGGTNVAPVVNYRMKIGQQNFKEAKKDHSYSPKVKKADAEDRLESSLKFSGCMVFALVVLLLGVYYAVFYALVIHE